MCELLNGFKYTKNNTLILLVGFARVCSVSSYFPDNLRICLKAKLKYRGMFETQKVRRHDKFRKEWSQHYNKCMSQMGQDQVSGGVSVLCWLAAPVAMFYGNLQNLVIRSRYKSNVQYTTCMRTSDASSKDDTL